MTELESPPPPETPWTWPPPNRSASDLLAMNIAVFAKTAQELPALVSRLRQMENALAWYADPAHWDVDGVCFDAATVDADRGARARLALGRHLAS